MSTSTIVCTQSGQVQGVIEGNLRAFRGIPYAAPPVGNLRWRSPAPPVAWSGIRDASTFGNECPQLDSNNNVVGNEDCLVLNVFASATPPSGKRPVIVFFHGGGDTAGSTQKAKFDSPPLANHGAVVVTAEYRLGLLGFLANSLLTAEDGLSYGQYLLLDQIAALQWVQKNIAAFGGDPTSHTERARLINLHPYAGAPELYPDNPRPRHGKTAGYRSDGAIRVSNSSNTWDGERSVTPSADET